MNAEGGGGVGVFDKEYQSAPVNCEADRLSAFCASRAKMSAIRTRHDKTTLLVTKGDNGHFRTLRAITYKKILNKSNAILAACLHLLATFGLECRAFACKKKYHLQKSVCGGGGGGKRPPCPSPSAAYVIIKIMTNACDEKKNPNDYPSVLLLCGSSPVYIVLIHNYKLL